MKKCKHVKGIRVEAKKGLMVIVKGKSKFDDTFQEGASCKHGNEKIKINFCYCPRCGVKL